VPAELAGPIMPARAIRLISGSERLKSNALSAIIVNASRRARRRLTALRLICYRELVERGPYPPSTDLKCQGHLGGRVCGAGAARAP